METYHRLRQIEGGILAFRRQFDKMDKGDIKQVYAAVASSQKLMYRYSETLSVCAKDIEAIRFRQGQDDYHSLLEIFLSRASDAHTVLPFVIYLGWHRDLLDAKRLLREHYAWHGYPFRNFEELSSFIGRRIDESLSVCRAYLCLLSSSMDSTQKPVGIASLAGEILRTQAKVYQDKCSDALSGPKESGRRWLEEKLANISFASGFDGKIRGFGPLIYFIIEHTITNMLKATYLSATKQRDDADFFKFDSRFAKIPINTDPRVSVEIADGKNSVTATFTDNGIGIPKESLARLFATDKTETVFWHLVNSNGSSLKLFPYIMDLTGIGYHIESEIGQGTRVSLDIPIEAAFIA